MQFAVHEPAILAGTANAALAAAIADRLGLGLSPCRIERFPDGEIGVQLLAPVRHKTVFVVQPTSPPVNDHLIELLALIDACRRSAAARIVVVVPYFGYARADKRHRRREPITARMVAEILEAVGIDQLVTLDLHTPQIEGFFHVPVDSLTAVPVLSAAIQERLPERTVVVSPDSGRVRMATEYAHRLRLPLIVLHKQRQRGGETAITHVVGEACDRACLIIDDMIATGGTIVESAHALRDAGARPEILVAATHGLFVETAVTKLVEAGVRLVFTTDTVPQAGSDQLSLEVVSVAPLLASAVQRFVANESISRASSSSTACSRRTDR